MPLKAPRRKGVPQGSQVETVTMQQEITARRSATVNTPIGKGTALFRYEGDVQQV